MFLIISFITFLIKVMFRKVMGDPPVGQIAFAFTTLGFLNALLMWPICVALYLTGTEIMPSDRMPWIILLIASILLLGKYIFNLFIYSDRSIHDTCQSIVYN